MCRRATVRLVFRSSINLGWFIHSSPTYLFFLRLRAAGSSSSLYSRGILGKSLQQKNVNWFNKTWRYAVYDQRHISKSKYSWCRVLEGGAEDGVALGVIRSFLKSSLVSLDLSITNKFHWSTRTGEIWFKNDDRNITEPSRTYITWTATKTGIIIIIIIRETRCYAFNIV